MNQENHKKIDTNPQETEDWLDSLDEALEEYGPERTKFLLGKLIDYAERKGARLPFNTNTPFINTIQHFEQKKFPGKRRIERRIKSIIRWNAMAMVVRANKESDGIGGHISSYASSATLYEIGFNHFFKGPNNSEGQDLIYFQGHSSPGIYARSYIEGKITKKQLTHFRRVLSDGGGLSSYPHPLLMPSYWQFATVSMGLSSIMSIYQARFMKYLSDREIVKEQNRKIWAFLGDGEMDEPESLGAISLAGREKLDKLIFVINCNLQRLDGPVRGNGKIIQELEGSFRGAGWNVIKVIWGTEWDDLIDNDTNGLLASRMEEVVDGELLKYVVAGGKYTREHFWGKSPELLKMVDHLSDKQLMKLRLGGHDPKKVYAAYYEAVNTKDKPTVILARTIKGYGLGEAGEGKNITHQQKKLNEKELLDFRDRFNIPLSDSDAINAPFYKPSANSKEINYIIDRRKKLGGSLPRRNSKANKIKVPSISIFDELLLGYKDRELSTTMAFVRLLTLITRDEKIGNNIVPIIPDEARTFGMDPLFRSLGIYAHEGQKYDPVDSDQYLYYKESKKGQIIEEGITEAGAISTFIAAATSYSNYKIRMIPFYIFYSMFGFQRIWDLIWAAADMRSRGFLIGGTAGRTTLNGEGLQHQDGHSHLAAAATPNLRAYDLAYAYEIAVVIHHGLKEMSEENKDVIYYITVENENYSHPKIPSKIKKDIVRGMYKIKTSHKPTVRLLGSGSIMKEVLAAAELLEKDWGIIPGIWNVTSYSELRKEAEIVERYNLIHPNRTQKKSHVEKNLEQHKVPTIATTDYIKMVPEQISPYVPGDFYALGTDGFGRSDTRENLRRFFEIDRYYIVLNAVRALSKTKVVDKILPNKVIKKYNLDPNKPNPISI